MMIVKRAYFDSSINLNQNQLEFSQKITKQIVQENLTENQEIPSNVNKFSIEAESSIKSFSHNIIEQKVPIVDIVKDPIKYEQSTKTIDITSKTIGLSSKVVNSSSKTTSLNSSATNIFPVADYISKIVNSSRKYIDLSSRELILI